MGAGLAVDEERGILSNEQKKILQEFFGSEKPEARWYCDVNNGVIAVTQKKMAEFKRNRDGEVDLVLHEDGEMPVIRVPSKDGVCSDAEIIDLVVAGAEEGGAVLHEPCAVLLLHTGKEGPLCGVRLLPVRIQIEPLIGAPAEKGGVARVTSRGCARCFSGATAYSASIAEECCFTIS